MEKGGEEGDGRVISNAENGRGIAAPEPFPNGLNGTTRVRRETEQMSLVWGRHRRGKKGQNFEGEGDSPRSKRKGIGFGRGGQVENLA